VCDLNSGFNIVISFKAFLFFLILLWDECDTNWNACSGWSSGRRPRHRERQLEQTTAEQESGQIPRARWQHQPTAKRSGSQEVCQKGRRDWRRVRLPAYERSKRVRRVLEDHRGNHPLHKYEVQERRGCGAVTGRRCQAGHSHTGGAGRSGKPSHCRRERHGYLENAGQHRTTSQIAELCSRRTWRVYMPSSRDSAASPSWRRWRPSRNMLRHTKAEIQLDCWSSLSQ
jgi:hypothetical protein